MKPRRMHTAAALAVAAALTTAGCAEELAGLAGLSSFTPVWITASWTGGAAGAPNDRTDREPAEFFGGLCPASHSLSEWPNFLMEY